MDFTFKGLEPSIFGVYCLLKIDEMDLVYKIPDLW